jgi:hypothetical protein
MEYELLLGLVMSPQSSDDLRHPRSVIAIRYYAYAVMHDLKRLLAVDEHSTSVFDFRYRITVMTRGGH